MASSSTTNFKARIGDTVAKIAKDIGVQPDEITALNPDLKPDSAMVLGKEYKIPTTAAAASMIAVHDIEVEYGARKMEADKSKDK